MGKVPNSFYIIVYNSVGPRGTPCKVFEWYLVVGVKKKCSTDIKSDHQKQDQKEDMHVAQKSKLTIIDSTVTRKYHTLGSVRFLCLLDPSNVSAQ